MALELLHRKEAWFIATALLWNALLLVSPLATAQTSKYEESQPLGSPIPFSEFQPRSNFGPQRPVREVLRDEEKFKEFWSELYPAHIYERLRVPEMPRVDFSKEVVIVLALGRRNSGGYAIDNIEVVNRNGRIEVLAEQVSPGSSCATTTSLTRPVKILRMDIPEKPIAFVVRERTRECK